MEVGYGQLVALLGALHPDLAPASIVARLQYLQRAGFPRADLAGGPGVRADYGPDGLMKLALAFELLRAGVPPASVVTLVVDGWADAGRSLALGWLGRSDRRDALPLFVRVNGIGAKARDVGRLASGTADDLRAWLRGTGDHRSVLVVDAGRVARAVAASVEMLAEPAGVATALDRWSGAGGGV